MAKVIEHGTETRDRLERAIEDEAMRQNRPPAWSKLDPDGAYGRPAERLLTKPIELTFEAEFAGALHQLEPQENVSYDAHGGEVDPATVRALNAAEDRQRPKWNGPEAMTPKVAAERAKAQAQTEANPFEGAFDRPSTKQEQERSKARGAENRKASLSRGPESLGAAIARGAILSQASDPLAAFIERRKPVERPEPDPRQHEMKLKRGPKL